MAKIEKIEIARRQVNAAIRSYLLGHDPIAVASLLFPASQILRDLNKNENAKSVSTAFSAISKECGYPPEKLWREFNDRTANPLKHVQSANELVDLDSIVATQDEAIMFCIAEYMFLMKARAGELTVSPQMGVFLRYASRKKERERRQVACIRFRDTLDRHFTAQSVSVRTAFWAWILNRLMIVKTYLERQATKRSA
ncbi:MAG: hypothetical protein HYR63_27775 [Proteobacteria bacterium]|nr:hypothetical protein [Pseudomonadota bacterium]MBI3497888.1 hypothetical protein [Pseudomonadota bacterium]